MEVVYIATIRGDPMDVFGMEVKWFSIASIGMQLSTLAQLMAIKWEDFSGSPNLVLISVVLHKRTDMDLPPPLVRQYQHYIAIVALILLLRYRRRLGRRPRRFYARPWITRRQQYGHYFTLLPELETGEPDTQDYTRYYILIINIKLF